MYNIPNAESQTARIYLDISKKHLLEISHDSVISAQTLSVSLLWNRTQFSFYLLSLGNTLMPCLNYFPFAIWGMCNPIIKTYVTCLN